MIGNEVVPTLAPAGSHVVLAARSFWTTKTEPGAGRMRYRLLAVRVLGYWALYAVFGVIVIIAAIAAADVSPAASERSPTRLSTKLVAGVSGLALAAGLLGLFLLRDPRASRSPSLALCYGGFALGALLTLLAWAMLSRDLERS